MTRKLGWLAIAILLAVPASAGGKPGTISGLVRNAGGVPQMGAVVEIFTNTPSALTVFTDAQGYYETRELSPGVYNVKVTAPSFLPSLRENVMLKAGASAVVNVTLNTLFEAIQLLPARRHGPDDDDNWKWTLRSASNRPILRVLEDGPLVVVSNSEHNDERILKARVSFMAGSEAEGFGSGDVSTGFNVESSMFSSGTLSLKGNVGYGPGPNATVLRAAYAHQMPSGSHPEVALTVRRFATPDSVAHNAALQALALSLSDGFTVGNLLDLNFGTEFQAIQFMGRVNALRPFGSVDVHLSPNTVVEYRYATSVPNTRMAKGFDTAPADLSESSPRLSLDGTQPMLERARHQEVSLSRRVGKNSFQVAAYRDRVANPALTGVGDVTAESGVFLPDVYSGTFTYNGGGLETNGLRLVAERKVTSEVTATLNYSYGGALDLPVANADWASLRSALRVERRHSLAGKVAGQLPGAKTRWIASYKWTSGDAVTPVDLFNVSPGQADPYLNIFIRQPIPGTAFLPGHMEALVDVRNLLAQGYVPVVGQDGHTLYLVQSARALRGGVAFTF